jgi:hypothetical protein
METCLNCAHYDPKNYGSKGYCIAYQCPICDVEICRAWKQKGA